jgi:ribosomal silencing factor RsfS
MCTQGGKMIIAAMLIASMVQTVDPSGFVENTNCFQRYANVYDDIRKAMTNTKKGSVEYNSLDRMSYVVIDVEHVVVNRTAENAASNYNIFCTVRIDKLEELTRRWYDKGLLKHDNTEKESFRLSGELDHYTK